MNNPNVLVVEESKEDVKKMKEAFEKKEKRLEKLGKLGETLTKGSTPLLIGSLLSPFDFEGPVIEIVTGITLLAGVIMKNVSINGLEKMEAIRTNGTNKSKVHLEVEDSKRIIDTCSELLNNVSHKKSKAKSSMM